MCRAVQCRVCGKTTWAGCGSHVDAVVAAEGLDDEGLQAALAKADEGCPFSSLLKRAGAAVHVAARLA